MAVRISMPLGGMCNVTFPYSRDLVDTLKSAVPAGCRSWDPRRKLWTVESWCVPDLVATLRALGYIVVDGTRAERPKPPPSRGEVTWAETLFVAVGPDRVEPVYRALVRVLHPDTGGDTVLMQQLNAARDKQISGRAA